jgi:hypothetical protein
MVIIGLRLPNAYLLSLVNTIEPPVGGSVHAAVKTPGDKVFLKENSTFYTSQRRPLVRSPSCRAPSQTTLTLPDRGGRPEIAISPTQGRALLALPAVFSLPAFSPAAFQPFSPALTWVRILLTTGPAVDGRPVKDLQFSTTVFQPAPAGCTHYRWSGNGFAG